LPAIAFEGILDLMNEITGLLGAIEQGDPRAQHAID
jgi:hypothetical protein